MRVLILTRGCAGCGKSTWIQENGLKQFTLCPDDIRLLCQSPIMLPDGSREISQNNEGFVWKTMIGILEMRMQRGEFTVIDATNSRKMNITYFWEIILTVCLLPVSGEGLYCVTCGYQYDA